MIRVLLIGFLLLSNSVKGQINQIYLTDSDLYNNDSMYFLGIEGVSYHFNYSGIQSGSFNIYDVDNNYLELSEVNPQFTFIFSGNRREFFGFYGTNDPHHYTYLFFIKSLSVKENNLNEIVLYPNPVSNILKVEVNDYHAEIKLLDLTGRVVIKTFDRSIDVSQLKRGGYFVRIGNVTKKIILN